MQDIFCQEPPGPRRAEGKGISPAARCTREAAAHITLAVPSTWFVSTLVATNGQCGGVGAGGSPVRRRMPLARCRYPASAAEATIADIRTPQPHLADSGRPRGCRAPERTPSLGPGARTNVAGREARSGWSLWWYM